MEMKLLQAHTANSGNSPAGDARFRSQIARTPPTSYTPEGYGKGNQHPSKTNEMNNMEITPGYSSINRTARFCPLFGRKSAVLGSKAPFLT